MQSATSNQISPATTRVVFAPSLSSHQNDLRPVFVQKLLQSSCCEIASLLSANEAQALIRLAQQCGFQSPISAYPPSYRNNQRLVVDDDAFAENLRHRLLCAAPRQIVDEDGSTWAFQGVNPRFRICQYNPGEAFFIHQDGVFHKSTNEKSFLTLLIYLNGAADFKGGSTRFFSTNDDTEKTLLEKTPLPGNALLFDHAVWHDGAQITEGTKYVLRSDLIYERTVEASTDFVASGQAVLPHNGYIWELVVAGNKIVTAGRDKRIVIWQNANGLLIPQAQITAHQNSVSALCSVKNQIWSGSRDQTIKIWSQNHFETTLPPRVLTVQGATVLNIIHLSEQNRVVSSDASGFVAIWTEDGQLINKFKAHTSWIWKMSNLGSGVFATCSEDGFIKVWSCIDQGMSAALELGNDPIWSLSAHGNFLFAGTKSGSVKKVELSRDEAGSLTLKLVSSLEHIHLKGIRSINALNDTDFLTGGEDNNVMHTVLSADNTYTHAVIASHANFVTSVHVHDGNALTTAYDGKILITPFQARGER